MHGEAARLAPLLDDLRNGRLTDGMRPADVVLLLQEAPATTAAPGFERVFAATARVGRGERGNAILSTLPLGAARTIELPRVRQRRIALAATVTVSGESLVIVNVHLENRASWWKGGLPADRGRARQMEALIEELPDGPGVLGGDLNVWLGTAEGAYALAAARFPDALEALPPATFRERLALDHVFFKLPEGWTAFRRRVEERYGSDHHPVVGVLLSR